MRFVPYLAFDGTCGEAFAFYERALGGRIAMRMTFGDSPMAGQMDPAARERIMHVRLEAGSTVLMGSDTPADAPADKGGFHVSVMTADPDEARRVVAALSEGATVTMPMAATFWSPAFGMLVDRFGTPWMVNCEPAAGMAAGTPAA